MSSSDHNFVSNACRTPVALFIFNRPELTKQVFRRIAQARPAKLLVIADAPRADRAGEAELCEQARSIATAVDWPCEVQTNFADQNLGCRRRIVSGLDWVFQQTEEAIILEDDVLPDPSFFPFCETLLERYRNNSRIGMIGGFSITQDKFLDDPASYYYSQMTHIWGWATWRRAWVRYDEHLRNWPEVRNSGVMTELFPEERHRLYWTKIFNDMHAGTGPNTWDYQWFYTNLMDSSFSIVPKQNLIANLGFGPDATHTMHAADNPATPVGSAHFPLIAPASLVPRHSLDLLDQDRSGCSPRSVRQKMRGAIRRTLSR